jgi:hypothetical protein
VSAGAAWERVVRAALLGTERQAAPVDAATDEPALDAAVAALSDQPAEARLLGTAALLDAWRRAGQRGVRMAAPPPEPAPEGDERPCSPVAARVLRQLLAGSPPPLLAEWMGLAERAGAAIPHELLPAVLDFGVRHAAVRADVARALGARGRWLAAQNPAWAYAGGVPDETAEGWETGTAEERVRILRHLRARDPAAGLALLRTTWATDAPRDRAAFVEALAVGLGMDDEPFLESALDDKRKEVRTAAAALLGTLPGSRLVARMTERLAPLLRVHVPEGMIARLRGQGPRLDVELPAECDKEMRRDGIEPKPPYGTGERGWWLQQMIAAVPPAAWTERWGMDAAACLDAARAGDERTTFVRGWTAAATRNRAADWAEALLRTYDGREGVFTLGGLSAALPPARLEPLILDLLRSNTPRAGELAEHFLLEARFPWSPAFTRAVVASLPTAVTTNDYVFRERVNAYAPHMHPATAVATLRQQGDPHTGQWVDLLHLRHTLHQAFE